MTITVIFAVLVIAVGRMRGLGGVCIIRLPFVRNQATSEYRLKVLVGARGEITIPAVPGTRGQVLVVTEAAGRTLLSAVSSQSLGTGDRVHVIGVEGSSLVVEKV